MWSQPKSNDEYYYYCKGTCYELLYFIVDFIFVLKTINIVEQYIDLKTEHLCLYIFIVVCIGGQ